MEEREREEIKIMHVITSLSVILPIYVHESNSITRAFAIHSTIADGIIDLLF